MKKYLVIINIRSFIYLPCGRAVWNEIHFLVEFNIKPVMSASHVNISQEE